MPARLRAWFRAGRRRKSENSNACESVRFVENLESRDFDLSPTTAARSAFNFERQRPEAAVRSFNYFTAETAPLQPAKQALIIQRRVRRPAKYEQPIRKRSRVEHSGANDRRRDQWFVGEGEGGRGKRGGVRAHEGAFVRSAFCATKRLISHFPSGRGTRWILRFTFFHEQSPEGSFYRDRSHAARLRRRVL